MDVNEAILFKVKIKDSKKRVICVIIVALFR